MIQKLLQEISKNKNTEKAQILQRFFKTWEWEYWYWDKFFWITVPIQRQIAKKFSNYIENDQIELLLQNEYHEVRLISLLIMIEKFKKANEIIKKQLYNIYLNNAKRINNRDLVDLSAPKIIWEYLIDKNRQILHKLSNSNNLWEKRISIVSTYFFIKNYDFQDTIAICDTLLFDKHDLIHKATWWMLREIWKRDLKTLENYLDKHYFHMPRTMLRYSIEKLSEAKRQFYMAKPLKISIK